jgi:hypothetical protein
MRTVLKTAILLTTWIWCSTAFATQIWLTTDPPECKVFMDGIELGKTFQDGSFKPFNVPAGGHVFRFARDGHVTDEMKVEVKGATLEIKGKLKSEEDLRREQEKRRQEEEERRQAEIANRKAQQCGILLETNLRLGKVLWNSSLVGTIDSRGVFTSKGMKPCKAKLEIVAKDYEPFATELELKSGEITSFQFREFKLSKEALERRAKTAAAEKKKTVVLMIGGGGFLLVLIAVVILLLKRRQPADGLLQSGVGTTTTGHAAPGLFTTENGGDEQDLNALLSSEKGIEALIGKRILGDYLIEKKIGQGGMGAILLAKQESLERPTALKIILPKFSVSENVVKRFFREVKLTSKLEHPNIITIYNFGKSREGILFVAMEFLDGHELDRIVKTDGRLSIEGAVSITAQIASALTEAHSKGVVHRDLKPSNIMLVKRGGRDDFVKVLDFGIAKSIEDEGGEESNLTMTGQILGTPAYMSPEQCSGKKLDARTDIYSLGIMSFELFTGKKPYVADSAIGFLQQHLMTPPPKLSDYAKDLTIPPDVDSVFQKVMAKAPDSRYASAADFARDLARAFDVELNVHM